MKIIFGQGNPGKQYEKTRHNVGFLAIDALANQEGADWKADSKFKVELAAVEIEGEKVLLVKPSSYYNETGQSARAIVDFYKLDPKTDFIVVHDELALPFGTVRVRDSGSDAGNNGIKSLNSHLGPDYFRIRVGVWNEKRDLLDDAAFVLSTFSSEESKQLKDIIEKTIFKLLNEFIAGKLVASSHKLK